MNTDWSLYELISIGLLCLIIFLLLIRRKEKVDLSVFTDEIKRNHQVQQEQLSRQLSADATEQFRRFDIMGDSIQATLRASREETNATLESRMRALQESNEKRLEQMQGIVDEKLQVTLETRLTQSFELVSRQLDSVQQGLGEMKSLAADARSLKNALINVKERGSYGEVRLEKLLSDVLAPNQYLTNVEIIQGRRVEFAVKLPGDGELPLLLPIDAKYPIEDYHRILDATDRQTLEAARKALAQQIRSAAKDIHDKYIHPPKTTDFALMFLPTEGLYAEVVQNVELFEELRRRYKVTAVGATTLFAFLSSLQMGFKTLALEQRSREVWDTLRSVKAEFGKFSSTLEKARKQLQTVDRTMDEIIGTRTRAIRRTLRSVEELDIHAEGEPDGLPPPPEEASSLSPDIRY